MLLTQKFETLKLILASGSPRRKELLEAMNVPFAVADKFDCDEIYPSELCPDMVARYISGLKSQEYPWTLAENEVLLTADTTVIYKDKVLGKPTSTEHAVQMLQMLSGNTHRVVSGVTLRSRHKIKQFSESTFVRVKKMTLEEIEYYVDNYKPKDKAGSYGIQEWFGLTAIERIEGSYFNVMGLPTEALYEHLVNF